MTRHTECHDLSVCCQVLEGNFEANIIFMLGMQSEEVFRIFGSNVKFEH